MYTIPAFSCAVLNVARASGVNGLTIDCIGAENPSEIIPSLGPSGFVKGTGPAMVLWVWKAWRSKDKNLSGPQCDHYIS